MRTLVLHRRQRTRVLLLPINHSLGLPFLERGRGRLGIGGGLDVFFVFLQDGIGQALLVLDGSLGLQGLEIGRVPFGEEVDLALGHAV